MENLSADIVDYLKATVLNWYFLGPGIFMVMLELLDKVWGWKPPGKAYIHLVFTVCLVVAMFLTWRDVYHANQRLNIDSQALQVKAGELDKTIKELGDIKTEMATLKEDKRKLANELSDEIDKFNQLGKSTELSIKLNRPKVQVISSGLHADGIMRLVKVEYKNLGPLEAVSLDARIQAFINGTPTEPLPPKGRPGVMMPGATLWIMVPIDPQAYEDVMSGKSKLELKLIIHYTGVLSEKDNYTYIYRSVYLSEVKAFERLEG